jgi:hypothetical protein
VLKLRTGRPFSRILELLRTPISPHIHPCMADDRTNLHAVTFEDAHYVIVPTTLVVDDVESGAQPAFVVLVDISGRTRVWLAAVIVLWLTLDFLSSLSQAA